MKRLKPTPAPGTKIDERSDAPARETPPPKGKNTILAVDDEPSNLAVMERIFRAEYRVLVANNGMEALAQMRAHPGEELVAILSDQRMPGMTGVELLAKSAEERPDVARVLVTGYSDMEAIVAAINLAHVMHYVSKPFDPQTIRDVVARAVDEKQRRREQRERFELLRKRNEELEQALARLDLKK